MLLSAVEWEGGDEWLRAQFKLYLASLLVTVNSNGKLLVVSSSSGS